MLHCLLAHTLKTSKRKQILRPLLDEVLEGVPVCPLLSKWSPVSYSGEMSQTQTVLHALFPTCLLLLCALNITYSTYYHTEHILGQRNQTIWNQVSQLKSLVMCVEFTCTHITNRPFQKLVTSVFLEHFRLVVVEHIQNDSALCTVRWREHI